MVGWNLTCVHSCLGHHAGSLVQSQVFSIKEHEPTPLYALEAHANIAQASI